MFLSDIKKEVSNFIIWKSTGPKKVLIIIVLNNFINIPLPNLMLTFLVRKLFIYG